MKHALKHLIRSSFIYRIYKPRKIHLYCVGTAKSGTNSIAALFNRNFRAAHEPENKNIIEVIFNVANKGMSRNELRDYLLVRDRRLRLEVDSSQFNYYIINELVELFKDAKFILTIRDPYTWLDSFINHTLAHNVRSHWVRFREFRFRANELTHPIEEIALKQKGLYTIDGYLSYWSLHNHKILNTVPEERLLVIRTDQISNRISGIAKFAGIPESKMDKQKSHVYKAVAKFNVLSQLDIRYLEAKVAEHCQNLMERFFPDIQSNADAIPSLLEQR